MRMGSFGDPGGEVAATFAGRVPEIASGRVVIRSVARAPGLHTKVAVDTGDPDVDPIGACIGISARRIADISAGLGGEVVDVSTWSPDAETMIRNALSPQAVVSVTLDRPSRRAVVTVRRHQYPTLPGRRAGNRELASQLSGWEIDIVPDPSAA
jgi:N utilization substance protein A